jgi:photosystem II stability/assembly factor-like uncharacterized protein
LEDLSLRAEFHRAIDAVAPPAPWLFASVREEIRQHRRNESAGRDSRRTLVTRPAWVLPVVAVLLAVAVVAALLFEARALQPKHTIPVQPPRGGALQCPAWGTNSSGGLVTPSDTMTSPTTGWSAGSLRTTDGGAHWRDVSPAAMRGDLPSGADARSYPPSYADFFLDSNHAWLARAYSSATSCFDHVGVFITSDGGRTWVQSAPVAAAIQADSQLELELDFIDPLHGWLMVLGNGRLAPDWFVYSTSDGGRDWVPVSQLPTMSSFCSVRFISLTTGYLGMCRNTGGPTATLTVTRDGGKTWDTVQLPQPHGSRFTFDAPVFFDQGRGVVRVTGTVTQGNTETPIDYLAATTDGGQTWHALPDLPAGFGMAFDFLDSSRFWVLMGDGRGVADTLYSTSDGGMTWTLVKSDLPVLDSPTLVFIDSQHGFIIQPGQQIGQGPSTVLVTGDGGKKWTAVNPKVS